MEKIVLEKIEVHHCAFHAKNGSVQVSIVERENK